jgi:uncharacterized membrane protein
MLSVVVLQLGTGTAHLSSSRNRNILREGWHRHFHELLPSALMFLQQFILLGKLENLQVFLVIALGRLFQFFPQFLVAFE